MPLLLDVEPVLGATGETDEDDKFVVDKLINNIRLDVEIDVSGKVVELENVETVGEAIVVVVVVKTTAELEAYVAETEERLELTDNVILDDVIKKVL